LAGTAGQPFIRGLVAAIPQPRQKAPVETNDTSLLDAFGRLLRGDTMESQALQLATKRRADNTFCSASSVNLLLQQVVQGYLPEPAGNLGRGAQ
jgi:hypothetical protein